MRQAYYVHGFASSARSTKAAMFRACLASAGFETWCPDLNEPDFETLTTTRMIAQIEADLATRPRGPVALIGSSLGGFVSVLLALRQAQHVAAGDRPAHVIDRLVLLAPALDFARTDYGSIDAAGVARWRDTGWLSVYHYAEARERRVSFALYEDARQYDALAGRLTVPALVFQGVGDAQVDPAMVGRYAAKQPTVTLRSFDDDHQLMGHIDTVIAETALFLGAAPRGR